MTDKAIACKKCKKKLFYLPTGYDLGVKVLCTECHDGGPKKTEPKAPVQASYSKMKKGVRKDIHPTYSFKSATEANFARVLKHLGLQWKYEERAFSFSEYKTKPHVYIMDFEVLGGPSVDSFGHYYGGGDFPIGFYEVKGYMTGSARQKFRRLKKNYPEEASRTTCVIYNKYKKADIEFCQSLGYRYMFYSDLVTKYSSVIPEWE
jgi:hypothetical protein